MSSVAARLLRGLGPWAVISVIDHVAFQRLDQA